MSLLGIIRSDLRDVMFDLVRMVARNCRGWDQGGSAGSVPAAGRGDAMLRRLEPSAGERFVVGTAASRLPFCGGRRRSLLVLAICALASAAPFSPGAAIAGCACVCFDGRTQPLCTSAYDRPAVCLPSPCPIVPRPLPPPDSRRSPPIGASSCRLAQVDTGSGYSWQRVCR